LIARQLVKEVGDFASRTLPMVARPPLILPPLSSLSRCLKMGWSDRQSQEDVTRSFNPGGEMDDPSRVDMFDLPALPTSPGWWREEPQL